MMNLGFLLEKLKIFPGVSGRHMILRLTKSPAAGFTTTGATVLENPGDLSHAMLIWRATTQWVGGMGIIVLSIAVLPMLGAGGVELAGLPTLMPLPLVGRVRPREPAPLP